jgi:hypothetical protein
MSSPRGWSLKFDEPIPLPPRAGACHARGCRQLHCGAARPSRRRRSGLNFVDSTSVGRSVLYGSRVWFPTPAEPARVAPVSASRSGPIPRVWCTRTALETAPFLIGSEPLYAGRIPHWHNLITCLGRVARCESGPRFHQPSPFFEKLATPVSCLDFVAHLVSQSHFRDDVGKAGTLACPIFER